MNMNEHILSADAQAILLLTGTLGKKARDRVSPLNIREFNDLAAFLASRGARPGHLLREGSPEMLGNYPASKSLVDRVKVLLERGATLALDIESWTSRGGWVLSRADGDYPGRLKALLKSAAPPILYGVGRKELLARGGLALVGSRDVDREGIEFARMAAARCAGQNIQVVSGGARGVDRHSMDAALERGGTVLGVLAEGLARASVDGTCRGPLMDGSLCLITPYHPEAGFDVGNAMGRNKVVYAISDWALAVSSQYKKGGTWAGAVENIKKGWVPMFVRIVPGVLRGNEELFKAGALSVGNDDIIQAEDLRAWFNVKAGRAPITAAAEPLPVAETVVRGAETPAPYPEKPSGNEVFDAVWPIIARELAKPASAKAVAKRCKVNEAQMKTWLELAVKLGMAEKSRKPIKYRMSSRTAAAEKSLFED